MAVIPILLLVWLQSPVKPKVTILATLTAASKTPSVKSIAPYRKALVSGDFTVLRVVSGADPSVKKGSKIRILLWGIVNGKPTSFSKLKKGTQIQIPIVPLSAWREMEREYQVDDLPVDKSTKYFVEFTKSK